MLLKDKTRLKRNCPYELYNYNIYIINLKVSFLYRHYNEQKEKCQRVSITGLDYKGQIVAWNHIILIFKFYSY